MVTGAIIRDARKARNLTQLDLAKKLGVNVSAVSQWERGDTSPRAHRMKKLLKLLGLSLTVGTTA